MMEKTLSVSAIKDGTVIDHITPGFALTIVHLLQVIESQHQVTVGMNLSSRSMGLKDLIKIENRHLTEKETHEIAIFAPKATINFVKNYKIEKKIKASLPEIVEKILVCPNLRCITNAEPLNSCFFVEAFKNKINLRCKYCEKIFEREEIKTNYDHI
jgi:aspartate carbamoyltransferase regulatory subunit